MRLKVILAAVLLSFSLIACGNSDAKGSNDGSGLVWHENLETAVEVAKVEGKNVLVNFTGSDWCQWCIKLNGEVFTKSEFAKYAKENLVLVKLDFPRYTKQSESTAKYNRAKMTKYGVRGFPSIILLDGNGNLVGNTGYRPGGPEKYVQHLEEYFSKK